MPLSLVLVRGTYASCCYRSVHTCAVWALPPCSQASSSLLSVYTLSVYSCLISVSRLSFLSLGNAPFFLSPSMSPSMFCLRAFFFPLLPWFWCDVCGWLFSAQYDPSFLFTFWVHLWTLLGRARFFRCRRTRATGDDCAERGQHAWLRAVPSQGGET